MKYLCKTRERTQKWKNILSGRTKSDLQQSLRMIVVVSSSTYASRTRSSIFHRLSWIWMYMILEDFIDNE